MPKGKRQTKGNKSRKAVNDKTKQTAPAKATKPQSDEKNPLFESRPRNFGIGNAIQPKRDLTRFVRWPKYIRMQRQKRVLYARLKVPPAINQFSNTLSKPNAIQLFSLLDKYKPETRPAKKQRLREKAKAVVAEGQPKAETSAPDVVKYGINHVTSLVESKEAQLVIIAHDVDPIELVVWLPALCRKLDIPYAIVKGKARLGQVVHKKTATALAITTVRKEDEKLLDSVRTIFREQFNNNVDIRRQWGGGLLGRKSMAAIRKKTKAAQKSQIAA